jgi:hypothetical protein
LFIVGLDAGDAPKIINDPRPGQAARPFVGQAFQPDVRNVRLESLTYKNAGAGSVRRCL